MADVVAQVVESVPRFVPQTTEPPKVEQTKAPETPAVTADTPKETGETPAQPPAGKGESGETRRMFRAIRQAAEAKAKAESLDRELKELREKTAQPQSIPGEPKMSEFSDIEEYAKAVRAFTKQHTEKEFQNKQREEQNQKERNSLMADWEVKLDTALAKHEDYMEKVGELKPDSAFHAALMQSDPEVAYHLASNRKEAIRILQLNPVAQIREIGRLEAKILAEPVAPPKPSKAPAPISPVSGTANVSEGIKPNQPPEEYMKFGHKLFRGK